MQIIRRQTLGIFLKIGVWKLETGRDNYSRNLRRQTHAEKNQKGDNGKK
jgi:hypothetical protein